MSASTLLPKHLAPEAIWLVTIECKVMAVQISHSGDGIFIPGSEEEWGFTHVQQWHHQIWPATGRDARHMDGIPYTLEDLRVLSSYPKYDHVEGIVAFSLAELRDLGRIDLDYLSSTRVTGNRFALDHITYAPFAVLDGQVLLTVRGSVHGYLTQIAEDAVPTESKS